jgi:hypothetical protein
MNVELQKMLQVKNFELLRTKILSLTKIYATSDLVFPLGESFCFVNTSTHTHTNFDCEILSFHFFESPISLELISHFMNRIYC